MGVFLVPSKILSGVGAINELGANIEGKGTKALIVTDTFMIKFGNVAKVTAALDANNIEYAVFDGVTGEPSDKMVAAGVEAYKANGCDFLIALGGGSPMDTAKSIGVMVASGAEKISDFMHKTINVNVPYLVAIPTTAGTGSEATQFTIINDTENNVKMLLAGPSVLPALAVVDPAFTMTAPPSVTANTGVDALCHAVEAYTSRKAQPLSDTFALSAIKRIHKNLPICYADGKNEQARMQMALGATEAGIAFNNSSVTIVHGMSRPIGALFHVPHGLSNAILLPACMEFAIQENTARFAEIARIMGVADENTADMNAAKAFVVEVTRFCKELGIPSTEEVLAKGGFTKEDFFAQLDKMATDALDSGSPSNTMKQPSKEDIIAIYKKLFD
ncbi:MAG TPA: iron-containing alcohol dehydrogenase [Candidatus Megamonas gallistercoris]|nr:iron-containing alcohol dehydrogenase [Candidatus Megamonas gallistercoris]